MTSDKYFFAYRNYISTSQSSFTEILNLITDITNSFSLLRMMITDGVSTVEFPHVGKRLVEKQFPISDINAFPICPTYEQTFSITWALCY